MISHSATDWPPQDLIGSASLGQLRSLARREKNAQSINDSSRADTTVDVRGKELDEVEGVTSSTKNRRKKPMKSRTSSTVEHAPNEIRAIPSGFLAPSAPPNSSAKPGHQRTPQPERSKNAPSSQHTRPWLYPSLRSASVIPTALERTPVLQSPPVRSWNPLMVAIRSRWMCPTGFPEMSSRVNPMMGPGDSTIDAPRKARCCWTTRWPFECRKRASSCVARVVREATWAEM